MQSEGGDCYSSDRFHQGLINLCHSFNVPLIYDEVQTGFHLSPRLFWHQQFKLKDPEGKPLFPHYITCAKKAQTGLVLSLREIYFYRDLLDFQVSSVI